MSTETRLRGYFDFDETVIADVAEAAERQNSHSFAELADAYDIADGPDKFLSPETGQAVDVLTLTPNCDYDEREARVLHLAFGAGIDDNAAMHAIRLFEADPYEQLVVLGSATSVGNSSGRLPANTSLAMQRSKTLSPLVRPGLQYLQSQDVLRTSHMGYSAGADKAATAIALSQEFGQEVSHGVVIEPVSIVQRGLFKLARDFAGTRTAQRAYIDQAASKPYSEVWSQDSLVKFAAYGAGLLRATNIATASVLANGGFEKRLHAALQEQSRSVITVGWGTESELVDGAAATAMVRGAKYDYGADRVRAMQLFRMRHAGVDDVDLHAAFMLQGLRA